MFPRPLYGKTTSCPTEPEETGEKAESEAIGRLIGTILALYITVLTNWLFIIILVIDCGVSAHVAISAGRNPGPNG